MNPETFKIRRQSLRLTQRALAAFLKISNRQVIRYEMGTSAVPGPLSILIDILVNRRIPRLKRRERRRPPV